MILLIQPDLIPLPFGKGRGDGSGWYGIRAPRHLIAKPNAMSPNEISRSSLLDLLFENRNKQYGAYVLRKYYDNRLSLSIGIMLAAVLLALFLVNVFRSAAPASSGDIFDDGGVIVSLVPDEPKLPDPPKLRVPVQSPAQKVIDFNNFRITSDPTDVASIDDIARAAVGSQTSDGPETVDGPRISDPGPGEGPVVPAVTAAPAPEVPEAPSAPPSFPGGMKAWTDFLVRNLQPSSDMQPGEKRSVVVRFWVDEEGHVGRFEVQQSGGAAFDNEVLRVLKRMPKWKPALQRGRPVATSFVQPVTFQAPEE